MKDLKFLLSHYLSEIWARRWSVLGVAWLVALIGCFFVASLPDSYKTTARVYVDTQTLLEQIFKKDIVAVDIQRQVDNVRAQMFARPNLKRLIRMTDLDLTVEDEVQEERLLQSLERRLEVTQENRDFYLVRFEDSSPPTTLRVVESLLSIFVETNLGMNKRESDVVRVEIERQLQANSRDMKAAEARLADFRRRHVDELSDRSLLVQRMRESEAAVKQFQLEKGLLRARRDQLQVDLAGTPQSITQGGGGGGGYTQSGAERRLNDLEDQLSSALLTKTEQHPDVVALRRLIQQARADASANPGRRSGGGATRTANPVHRQIQSQLQTVELEYSQMDDRIAQEQEAATIIRRILERQPEILSQLEALEREYGRLQQRDSDLKDKKATAVLTGEIGDNTSLVEFRVIEPPTLPVTPAGPNRLILFTGVLVAALTAGFGVTLARIQMADAFPTLVHLREAFDLPILGSVSMVPEAARTESAGIRLLAFTIATTALFAMFLWLIYLYHFELWRPNLTALADRVYFWLKAVF